MKDRKSFSIIDLLVIISVAAVLTAILLPTWKGM